MFDVTPTNFRYKDWRSGGFILYPLDSQEKSRKAVSYTKQEFFMIHKAGWFFYPKRNTKVMYNAALPWENKSSKLSLRILQIELRHRIACDKNKRFMAYNLVDINTVTAVVHVSRFHPYT